MYFGVPLVGLASRSKSWATPKSRTFTTPEEQRKTFAGLRSRCRTPAACACSSAPATADVIRRASRGSIGPRAILASSGSPWSNSKTMKAPCSQLPESKSVTMAGWFRRATASASRRIHSVSLRVTAMPWRRSFRATCLPRSGSVAA